MCQARLRTLNCKQKPTYRITPPYPTFYDVSLPGREQPKPSLTKPNHPSMVCSTDLSLVHPSFHTYRRRLVNIKHFKMREQCLSPSSSEMPPPAVVPQRSQHGQEDCPHDPHDPHFAHPHNHSHCPQSHQHRHHQHRSTPLQNPPHHHSHPYTPHHAYPNHHGERRCRCHSHSHKPSPPTLTLDLVMSNITPHLSTVSIPPGTAEKTFEVDLPGLEGSSGWVWYRPR